MKRKITALVAAFVGAFVRTRYGVCTLGSRWKRVPTQRHPSEKTSRRMREYARWKHAPPFRI